ncbi:bifunctional folylpolyglutamate synthase/dihydrofolate synthase [Aspergillus homomorphus CBS 101889]|uniref:Folylpolyglutamate synthase n=1 Tax=Aspergillus homomorphus (strain CBS 101889) TaxID=1450537 RepID=A0A395HNK9_ASPHC|nr:putative tetrahydrofolylpolyglutamate synthase [Aspergillus homomorphus CBS 101889]RAL09340.1 putative tetrahydrofolylpolyglutamate synthase [Aspergillus homomorphus CBS 101889]
MNRTYENALKLLETRRRPARPRTPTTPAPNPEIVNPNVTKTVRGIPSLYGMREWLQTLGHSDAEVARLNIVHVTGTKGKGSTCAFTRSILHAHGLRTGFPKRVGLYTSPDLQCIRERIQIDDRPVTEALFTKYFFEVWEKLMPGPSGQGLQNSADTRQPRYLQFLALLAFHTFIRENVEAAVFETHHGGEFDATNVIQNPVVTGITSLGLDHVAQLGPTIENIAWHKAGIFKPGAPAFSLPQEAGPAEIMRARAAERNTTLNFVPPNPNLPHNSRVLGASVQRLNCSLAVELAKAFVKAKRPDHTIESEDISAAVRNFSWVGRFEIIEDGPCQWFLDGAHNTLSLRQAAEWFFDNTKSSGVQRGRVLIFSHFSENRDGLDLVEYLAQALSELDAMPDHVIFTTYNEREDGSTRIDKTLKAPEKPFPDLCSIYSTRWKEFDSQATVSTTETIEEAIKAAKSISAQHGGIHVLVTGSLHLVGGALNILRP